MTKQTKKSKLASLRIPRLGRNATIALLCVLSGVVLLIVGITSLALAYRGKIYPNITVASIAVGGKTKTEAAVLIRQAVTSLPDTIDIQIDGRSVGTVATKDIRLAYDPDAIAGAAYQYGRNDTTTKNIATTVKTIFRHTAIPAAFTLDEAATLHTLTRLSQSHGTMPKDATITLINDSITVTPEQAGFGVAPEQLFTDLKKQVAQFKLLVTETSATLKPQVTAGQAEYAKKQVEEILRHTPVTLVADEVKIAASNQEVFSWLRYELQSRSALATPTPLSSPLSWLKPSIAHASNHDLVLVAVPDTNAIKKHLEAMAAKVNREAENATLKAVNGSVQVSKADRSGRSLTIDTAIETIREALTTQMPAEIRLPVTIKPAAVRANNLTELGIKELISRGETQFKGSSASRIHNIKTGATYLSGSKPEGTDTAKALRVIATIE